MYKKVQKWKAAKPGTHSYRSSAPTGAALRVWWPASNRWRGMGSWAQRWWPAEAGGSRTRAPFAWERTRPGTGAAIERAQRLALAARQAHSGCRASAGGTGWTRPGGRCCRGRSSLPTLAAGCSSGSEIVRSFYLVSLINFLGRSSFNFLNSENF